ncbi:MAG: PIN domain-containing protein [Verrucomicrobiota bacterium]
MKSVFVDTGYLLALEIVDDQHHGRAVTHWREFSRHLPKLITTSYVFDEVTTFFNRRGHHDKAIKIGNQLLSSPSVQLIHIEPIQFTSAWDLFRQYQDKGFSFTDCLSFVVMRQRELDTALTFDHHFTQAGYKVLPED